jgi:enoyl-CoA hydratase/carnithine racemase
MLPGMSDVLYEFRDPGIGLITLNRPDKLNAWTDTLSDLYFGYLRQCAADPAVKVIVVTGAGKGFCAGADMNTLQDLSAAGAAAKDAGPAAGRTPQYFTTLIPKPVIAAINGACAGMGLSQALMCDMRFAARDAKFTTAFSRRGLIAEWGTAWLLPRLVGTARAFDLLFSGRVFLGEEAAQMGLVNAAVDGDVLLDHTLAYAADLAVNASPASMAVMKRQVYADWDKELIPAHNDAVRLMIESFQRPDFKEGVQSYLQKRPPAFPPVTEVV